MSYLPFRQLVAEFPELPVLENSKSRFLLCIKELLTTYPATHLVVEYRRML